MPPITRVPPVVRAADGPDAKRRAYAHYGWFYDWRTQAMIAWRGTLEFDFLTIIASQPDVRAILRRAEPIRFHDRRAWRLFKPNFRVVYERRGDREIWDYAVLSEFDLPDRLAVLNRVQRHARTVGRNFTWLTNRQIRAEPRLTNSKLILSQAGQDLVPIEALNRVRAFAAQADPVTVASVTATGGMSYAEAYSAILNLVARGELAFEHDRYFDGDTSVRRRVAR